MKKRMQNLRKLKRKKQGRVETKYTKQIAGPKSPHVAFTGFLYTHYTTLYMVKQLMRNVSGVGEGGRNI